MTNYYSVRAEKIIKSILSGIGTGVANGNQEVYQNESVEATKNIIEKLCDSEQKLMNEKALIKSFKCQSFQNFEDEYKQQLAESSASALGSPKETERYKNFMRNLEDIEFANNQPHPANNASVSVDGMTVQESSKRIDPITKNPILNPVRLRKCNHLYNLESITEAIKINKRTKCAYVGCTNQSFITQADLIEDRSLKRKLLQEQQDMEQQEDSLED